MSIDIFLAGFDSDDFEIMSSNSENIVTPTDIGSEGYVVDRLDHRTQGIDFDPTSLSFIELEEEHFVAVALAGVTTADSYQLRMVSKM